MKIAVDLCAATLAVSLHHLCGLPPLTGFMGSKRRWAPELADAAFGRGRLDRVIAVDAGPWGDVWVTLTNSIQRARVVARLRELDGMGTLKELWPELVAESPSEDPARRVAQYLGVQARATNNLPVWWEPGHPAPEAPAATPGEEVGLDTSTRGSYVISHPNNPAGPRRPARCKGIKPKRGAFVVPTKTYETAPWRTAAAQHSRVTSTQDNTQTGGDEGPALTLPIGWTMPQSKTDTGLKSAKPKAPGGGDGGMKRVATLADRIERIPVEALYRIKVIHGKVQDVKPIPGAFVLFDPPYQGAPRYAEVLPRAEVLDVARAWSRVASRVVVCEGEPLPLDGWQTYRLAAKEWVTAWGLPHAPGAQLNLITPRFAGDK